MRRIVAVTVVGAVALTLSYITTAAYVIVALALAAQVACFARWWHYANVMDAVGDKAISAAFAEDGVVVQEPKGRGLRGFAVRHPVIVGIGSALVGLGILIGVIVARHYV